MNGAIGQRVTACNDAGIIDAIADGIVIGAGIRVAEQGYAVRQRSRWICGARICNSNAAGNRRIELAKSDASDSPLTEQGCALLEFRQCCSALNCLSHATTLPPRIRANRLYQDIARCRSVRLSFLGSPQVKDRIASKWAPTFGPLLERQGRQGFVSS